MNKPTIDAKGRFFLGYSVNGRMRFEHFRRRRDADARYEELIKIGCKPYSRPFDSGCPIYYVRPVTYWRKKGRGRYV